MVSVNLLGSQIASGHKKAASGNFLLLSVITSDVSTLKKVEHSVSAEILDSRHFGKTISRNFHFSIVIHTHTAKFRLINDRDLIYGTNVIIRIVVSRISMEKLRA